MIAVLEQRGNLTDPQEAREDHTHIVRCTQGEETWMRHGGKSYCGWVTGGNLAGTAMHAALAADAREPAVLASLVARATAAGDGVGGGGGGSSQKMGVRSVRPRSGMPCGKLDRIAVTMCPPIEGMVCNGNPTTGRGVCVISERDSWVQHGCLSEYTAGAAACKTAKLVTVNGKKDVQDAIDCSMRHADKSLPVPEWRAGAGDVSGGGAGAGGGVRSGCDVLHADAFLEFKYTYIDGFGKASPEVVRLTMEQDGNLVISARRFKSGEYSRVAAPFEAVAEPYAALNINGIGAGRFVNGYTMYALGRPPFIARLTPRALELVNGLGRVYWELLLPTRFDPTRLVFVRFQVQLASNPIISAVLEACGVPRGAACADDDPECRQRLECDTLQHRQPTAAGD
jgi:hypothetical protein